MVGYLFLVRINDSRYTDVAYRAFFILGILLFIIRLTVLKTRAQRKLKNPVWRYNKEQCVLSESDKMFPNRS